MYAFASIERRDGWAVEVALRSRPAQHADPPGLGQRAVGRGGGCHGEHRQSVPAGEVLPERGERAG